MRGNVERFARTLVWVVIVGGIALATAAAGFVCYEAKEHPKNEDILGVNENDRAISDVVVKSDAGTPHERIVARFAHLDARATELLEDPGFGSFSVEYTDGDARWIASDVLVRDDPDDLLVRRDPSPLCITDDLVADVRAERAR